MVTILWKRTRVWVWLCFVYSEYRFVLFSHVVKVSALSICIVLRPFIAVLSWCLLMTRIIFLLFVFVLLPITVFLIVKYFFISDLLISS